MFTIELNLFSIGTIVVSTHIEHVPYPVYIPDIGITESVKKEPVKMVGVLVVKLVIPLDIVKQHLLESFFHLKVGKMIIDETPI
jgi:hypothetical protein